MARARGLATQRAHATGGLAAQREKRARPGHRGQRWQARLEGPFEGEGPRALRELLRQQDPLKFR